MLLRNYGRFGEFRKELSVGSCILNKLVYGVNCAALGGVFFYNTKMSYIHQCMDRLD